MPNKISYVEKHIYSRNQCQLQDSMVGHLSIFCPRIVIDHFVLDLLTVVNLIIISI